MPSSYQVVLWKQESFVVLRPLHIEFFRNLLNSQQGAVRRSPVFGIIPECRSVPSGRSVQLRRNPQLRSRYGLLGDPPDPPVISSKPTHYKRVPL
jgi:hypothetical protein